MAKTMDQINEEYYALLDLAQEFLKHPIPDRLRDLGQRFLGLESEGFRRIKEVDEQYRELSHRDSFSPEEEIVIMREAQSLRDTVSRIGYKGTNLLQLASKIESIKASIEADNLSLRNI